MMYKAARASFRLDELTVGTYNVLTEAVNGFTVSATSIPC